MTFSHDTQHALLTIVDLVNSDPAYGGHERLGDVAALESFVLGHRITHSRPLSATDVEAVRAIRGRLSRFFELGGSRALGAQLANEMLAGARTQPRLTDHDGFGWHMHYFSPDADLAEHLAVDGGMALAQVVAADEVDRLRTCQAPTCHAVLVDFTRNRSKRYCDAVTCGNRLHVAAYRERRRSARISGAV